MIVSALFALLFWLVLIVSKRSDQKKTIDFSEDESEDQFSTVQEEGYLKAESERKAGSQSNASRQT